MAVERGHGHDRGGDGGWKGKSKKGKGEGALLLAVFGGVEGGESAWEREALPPHLGRTRAVAQRWGRRQSGRGRLRGAGGPGRTATEGGRPPRGSARAEQGRGGIQRRRQESVPVSETGRGRARERERESSARGWLTRTRVRRTCGAREGKAERENEPGREREMGRGKKTGPQKGRGRR